MAGKAISVVVLVCPQCGKKYKGDPSRPDARYQCPADQSTLIRLDSAADEAIKRAKADVRAAAGQQAQSEPDGALEFTPSYEGNVAAGNAVSAGTPVVHEVAAGGAAAAPARARRAETPPPRAKVDEESGGLLSGFEPRRSVVAT